LKPNFLLVVEIWRPPANSQSLSLRAGRRVTLIRMSSPSERVRGLGPVFPQRGFFPPSHTTDPSSAFLVRGRHATFFHLFPAFSFFRFKGTEDGCVFFLSSPSARTILLVTPPLSPFSLCRYSLPHSKQEIYLTDLFFLSPPEGEVLIEIFPLPHIEMPHSSRFLLPFCGEICVLAKWFVFLLADCSFFF